MSSGEFGGGSNDTAVDPVTDEALPTPSAEPLSEPLDHNFIQDDGQSDATVQPLPVRLRLKPPPERL